MEEPKHKHIQKTLTDVINDNNMFFIFIISTVESISNYINTLKKMLYMYSVDKNTIFFHGNKLKKKRNLLSMLFSLVLHK